VIARLAALALLAAACSHPEPVRHPYTVALLHHDQDRIVCGAVIVGPHEMITANHCLSITALSESEALDHGVLLQGDTEAEREAFAQALATMPVGGRGVRFVLVGDHLPPVPMWVAAEVLATYPDLDLAVLHTEKAWPSWAHVARVPVVGGTPIKIVHHPHGRGWQVDRGQTDAIPVIGSWVGGAIVRVEGGSSGGGLWDSHGQLVGVVTHAAGTDRWAVFSDVRAINRALERR